MATNHIALFHISRDASRAAEQLARLSAYAADLGLHLEQENHIPVNDDEVRNLLEALDLALDYAAKVNDKLKEVR